jgi:hypothetical protein
MRSGLKCYGIATGQGGRAAPLAGPPELASLAQASRSTVTRMRSVMAGEAVDMPSPMKQLFASAWTLQPCG